MGARAGPQREAGPGRGESYNPLFSARAGDLSVPPLPNRGKAAFIRPTLNPRGRDCVRFILREKPRGKRSSPRCEETGSPAAERGPPEKIGETDAGFGSRLLPSELKGSRMEPSTTKIFGPLQHRDPCLFIRE